MTWAQQDRFASAAWSSASSAASRTSSGRAVRVRGAQKVMARLVFGVLFLTVDQLLKLTG